MRLGDSCEQLSLPLPAGCGTGGWRGGTGGTAPREGEFAIGLDPTGRLASFAAGQSQTPVPALDRDKAQFLVIAGKKRTEAAWPAGRYAATYRVIRDGAEVLRKTFDVEARSR